MNSPRPSFVVFFIVVTAIYGGVHAFLWWKTSRQLNLRGPWSFALALLFAALVISPFLGRLLRNGSALFNTVELLAFLWMGAAFYLFALNLGADLWNVAGALVRRGGETAQFPNLGGPRLFWAIAAATALILGWAAIEAANVRLVRLTVPTRKLAPGTPPLRIAQVSDIHLGLLVGKRRLGAILERVREARPDVLVSTGDMLDAVGDHLDPLATLWREVAPRFGKYAVTGNHEYYSGIAGALAFFNKAGFRVLRDETVALPAGVNIIGREYRGPRSLSGPPGRQRTLEELARAGDPLFFTLLLQHLPTGLEEAQAHGVDLQLSGHTHDGQLFPFRWLVRLMFRHLAGLHRQGDTLLYVSRGTGTWGPPMRVLSPPEITLFELRRSSSAN